MATIKPDPSFYPSPESAIAGPPEDLAYVVTLDTTGNNPDALNVVDVGSGERVGRLDMPNVGDELHHFGWNACSSALCPWAAHPHVERRYFLVPGLRSSRIHVVDVKDDPRAPKLAKVIEPDELAAKTNYSRPHTFHCGPDGLYASALGAPDGDGPGGVFLLDHDDFSVKGQWEADRGPQELAYDIWWNIGFDRVVTSEWGTPNMVESGVNPELLLGGKYGHQLHIWDMRKRTHQQAIDLGPEQQMVLELRPAHDPNKPWGFVGVVVSTADLSASVWLWHPEKDNGKIAATKVIEIPAEPAETEQLPPALQPFGAVPPLVTDIALSVDDKSLYVSCWASASSSATTSATRSIRARPARCVWAASSSARRTRPRARSTAGRRWSRSAATASACTSRARSTRAGTRSSTPRGSTAGWSSWTPRATSRSTPTSSSPSRASGPTRCASPAATPARTATASPTRASG